MKLLMISSDKKIFENDSAVQQRMIEYGELVNELHIIVFTEIGFDDKKTGNNVHLYPTNSKNKWHYISNAIRIGKTLKQIDLVTTQDPFEAGFAGWRIARAFGARLQLQIHTDFLSPYFVKSRAFNKIRVRIARFLLPKSDCIRVVSKRIKKSLIKTYKIPVTKINILPIFVDVAKIQNTEIETDIHEKYPQFNFVILMASRLSQEKNMKMALDAFKDVLRTYPETGLVIVGDGPERHNLGAIVSEYGIDKNVIFEGWQKDTISYHKTADLFLNTSNYEGYGVSLIEAIASDTAIVTTNVGIVGEILTKNNAFICEVGDTRCITRNIMNAIENKSVCKELARSATYAISNIPRKNVYLELYKKNWEDCV